MSKLSNKLFEKSGRWLANQAISVLSVVFRWGISFGYLSSNPAFQIDKIERSIDAPIANRAWTQHEFLTVLTEATPEMRLAISLEKLTGARQADVLSFKWNCDQGDRFVYMPRKTRRKQVIVALPVDEHLRRLLDDAPKRGDFIVSNRRGKQYSESGFRSNLYRLISRLEANGQIAPGCTFHGLRHTLGKALAEHGATPTEIQAVLGHKTLDMAEQYTREVNRETAATAAMSKLWKGRRTGTSPENK